MKDELLAKAKRLGLKSLVWTDKGDKPIAAAAWPYVGYGATEDEALQDLIQNVENNKTYNS